MNHCILILYGQKQNVTVLNSSSHSPPPPHLEADGEAGQGGDQNQEAVEVVDGETHHNSSEEWNEFLDVLQAQTLLPYFDEDSH